MAKFFQAGDLREAAKAVVPVDWETGDALGSADHPMHVEAAAGELVVSDGWTVDTILDQVQNQSNKVFRVTGGQVWQVLSVHVLYVSSATVGTRRLSVAWADENDVLLGWVPAGVTQAASLSYYYTFAPSLADYGSTRGTLGVLVNTPLPSTLILPPLCWLHVMDLEQIATATDDLRVNLLYAWKAA
jgi:hypothetical protein